MKLRPAQEQALGGCAPCQLAQVQRDPTPGEAGSGPPPKSVIVVDPSKEGWIGIELVDTKKKPVPNAAFTVTLPNQQQVPGTLDENGKARIEGIDPGQCTIVFPNIDRRDFV